MNKDYILAQARAYIQEKFRGEASGHDWWHVHRVHRLALHLAQEEGADLFVTQLGALLHDIADHKFHGGDEQAGPRAAREWLERTGAEPATVDAVCHIVANVSFKGGAPSAMESLEGKIVQDADRLDALGAIGIARTFAYSGFAGGSLYDPEHKPNSSLPPEKYPKGKSPAINHFYEKLLLLKDRMNTEAAKKVAERRHQYMEEFLRKFYQEWEAEDMKGITTEP